MMKRNGPAADVAAEPVGKKLVGRREKSRQMKSRNSLKSDIPFYLFLLPAMLLLLIFNYIPMVGVLMAFEDFDPYEGFFSPLADNYGFANFITIFKDPSIFGAIWNTLYLNLLGLVVSFPAPLIFALLLNEVSQKPFKKTVQTISYLPYFLSWIAVTGMTTNILSEYGAVNNIIVMFGGERILFMTEEKYFIPIYLILTVWKGVGWGSIIYLSNIASISPELYESAQIDGAGHWKQAIYITLPALMPTAMILLILQAGQMLGSNFELVYGLRSDYYDMEVISTWVYFQGFNAGNYSVGTALSVFQSAVALILTLIVNKVSEKVSSISLW